eukprot:IDg7317t1
MAMENYSQPTKNVCLACDAWISKLSKHVSEFQKELIKLQQRYKKNYDKHLRIRRKHFEVGGYALLSVEKNSVGKSKRRNKLAPIADGILRVTTVKERTIVIERPDRTSEEVSIDRIEPATLLKDNHNTPMPQLQYTSKRNSLEGGEEDPTEAPTLYIVDKIGEHGPNPDSPEGQFLYKVKWYGYSEPTWEPTTNLRRSMQSDGRHAWVLCPPRSTPSNANDMEILAAHILQKIRSH